MEIWKPPEVWLEKLGNRREYKAHCDFSLSAGSTLTLQVTSPVTGYDELLDQYVPKGKVWKCHYEICMEEFDE